MKSDKKRVKKLVYVLLIISVLLVSVILIDRVLPFIFVTRLRNTIEITSDGDFVKYDFPGNGSKDNPIVIADLEIGTKNRRIRKAYQLIEISNTSYHVIIENCCLIGGATAISVGSLRGGSITIRNNSFIGVEHYTGPGCEGYFTTLFFEIWIASNINVANNTFEGRSWGMIFAEVYNSSFSDNTVSTEHRNIGLEIHKCRNLIIEKNLVEGIGISDSDYLNITDNVISGNRPGLLIGKGYYIFVARNTFLNCTNYAIKLYSESMFVEIFHNSFLDNNIDGVSQAFDSGISNIWFSSLYLEGNFWSDLGGNLNYTIDGSAGSIDLYPLSSPK